MLQISKFKLNYPISILLYFILFAGLTFQFWAKKEVIASHRQNIELRSEGVTQSNALENRKFSDISQGFIPELSQHLTGKRSGWLKLWTNQNALGRPMLHIMGLSPAYFPIWILSQFIHNPWYLLTIFSLLSCFLAGLFIILFCKEQKLTALAALTAGTSLASCSFFMYWLTFPLFISAVCWSAGILWSIVRIYNRADFWGWIALTFCVYSLALTAYPQLIVFQMYLIGGFICYLFFKKMKNSKVSALKFSLILCSAFVFGFILTLPVYLDLVYTFLNSARVKVEPSFFTSVLPSFENIHEFVRFLLLGTIPKIFGNPIAPNFPFAYDGMSINLLIMFFMLVAMIYAFSKTWGWWLVISILLLFAMNHSFYSFGVKYLGFNFSRANPLSGALLAISIIVAYGVDALANLSATKSSKWMCRCGIALMIFAVIFAGILYCVRYNLPIHRRTIGILVFVSILLSLQIFKVRPVLLIFTLIVMLAVSAYPLMLHQSYRQLATSSALANTIKENLPSNSRFAIVPPEIWVLPPNLNADLEIPSVHSYDGLSPKSYQHLIHLLGGEVRVYGRWNSLIDPDYLSSTFWMSNIRLILSSQKLMNSNLSYLGALPGINLYKVVSAMGESLQVELPKINLNQNHLNIQDPRHLTGYHPVKTRDENDLLEFKVFPMQNTVLILSQIFHRDWKAKILTTEGWLPTKTFPVNEIFQGVLLPKNATMVRLEFKPWVRFAWLAHGFWMLIILLLLSRLTFFAFKQAYCSSVGYKNFEYLINFLKPALSFPRKRESRRGSR